MTDEKRKHIRVEALNLSHVSLDETDEPTKESIGRTLNVSESGILLETHFPIQARQHVTLSIGIEEDLVDLKGRVIHLIDGDSGKFEMGIEFTDIDEDAVTILRDFIRTFKAAQKPPR